VAIDHRSICNTVKVAVEVYGVRSRDRVYLDPSLSSDRAVEQVWSTWASGATLVPDATRLRGQQLHRFMTRSRISAVYGTAKQLADMPSDLPELKLVLLAGEPVPTHQIARWHRPDRRVLRTYSPTPAVVAATWTELHPESRSASACRCPASPSSSSTRTTRTGRSRTARSERSGSLE
jgi:non-ribosomal peptide synthetase component F